MNGAEQRPVSEREPVDINKNNFDNVLTEFSPSVNLSVAPLAGDGSEENISLTFAQMKDFEPESVARQPDWPSNRVNELLPWDVDQTSM